MHSSANRVSGSCDKRASGATTFTDGPLDVPGHPVPIHTPGHTSGHVAVTCLTAAPCSSAMR